MNDAQLLRDTAYGIFLAIWFDAVVLHVIVIIYGFFRKG